MTFTLRLTYGTLANADTISKNSQYDTLLAALTEVDAAMQQVGLERGWTYAEIERDGRIVCTVLHDQLSGEGNADA